MRFSLSRMPTADALASPALDSPRRRSRHSRQMSIATRGEGFELMSGQPMPSAPGRRASRLSIRFSALEPASALFASKIIQKPLPPIPSEWGTTMEVDSDEQEDRTTALEKLEGRHSSSQRDVRAARRQPAVRPLIPSWLGLSETPPSSHETLRPAHTDNLSTVHEADEASTSHSRQEAPTPTPDADSSDSRVLLRPLRLSALAQPRVPSTRASPATKTTRRMSSITYKPDTSIDSPSISHDWDEPQRQHRASHSRGTQSGMTSWTASDPARSLFSPDTNLSGSPGATSVDSLDHLGKSAHRTAESRDETLVQQLSELRERHQLEVTALQRELEEVRHMMGTQLTSVTAARDQATGRVEALEQQVQDMQAQLEDTCGERDMYREDVDDWRKRCSNLEQTIQGQQLRMKQEQSWRQVAMKRMQAMTNRLRMDTDSETSSQSSFVSNSSLLEPMPELPELPSDEEMSGWSYRIARQLSKHAPTSENAPDLPPETIQLLTDMREQILALYSSLKLEESNHELTRSQLREQQGASMAQSKPDTPEPSLPVQLEGQATPRRSLNKRAAVALDMGSALDMPTPTPDEAPSAISSCETTADILFPQAGEDMVSASLVGLGFGSTPMTESVSHNVLHARTWTEESLGLANRPRRQSEPETPRETQRDSGVFAYQPEHSVPLQYSGHTEAAWPDTDASCSMEEGLLHHGLQPSVDLEDGTPDNSWVTECYESARKSEPSDSAEDLPSDLAEQTGDSAWVSDDDSDEKPETKSSPATPRPEFIPEWSFEQATFEAARDVQIYELAGKHAQCRYSRRGARRMRKAPIEDFFGILNVQKELAPPLPVPDYSLEMPPIDTSKLDHNEPMVRSSSLRSSDSGHSAVGRAMLHDEEWDTNAYSPPLLQQVSTENPISEELFSRPYTPDHEASSVLNEWITPWVPEGQAEEENLSIPEILPYDTSERPPQTPTPDHSINADLLAPSIPAPSTPIPRSPGDEPISPRPGRFRYVKRNPLTRIPIPTPIWDLNFTSTTAHLERDSLSSEDDYDVCPQPPAWNATEALKGQSISFPSVRQTAERLSKAVQFDTTVEDAWPDPDEDDRLWAQRFPVFSHWLTRAFPAMHKNPHIRREKIHRHGLLYTWEGSDPSLKPLLLMSHQDVVAVENSTRDKWAFPPFSGHIDLEHQAIWGRGAVDCKQFLIGILSAVETLAQSHFRPQRTILLNFGFDEESGVDEGTPILSSNHPYSFGMPLALVAVTEKGSLNMHMSISSPGGHSSSPPPHTSVGIMSKIITVLEENPFPPAIEDASHAAVRHFQCARDAPKVPARLRQALRKLELAERATKSSSHTNVPLLRRWYETLLPQDTSAQRLANARADVLNLLSDNELAFFRTTQAADVFRGGIKVNALPERAEAFVNHRIATHSSIKETIDHYIRLLEPMAHRYRYALTVFDREIVPVSKDTFAHVKLQDSSFTIDTKPSTPFEGPNAAAYELVASVIRGTYYLDEPRRMLDDSLDSKEASESPVYTDSVRVSPTTLPANTDTSWYHNLTRNIIRFGPQSLHPDLTGLIVDRHLQTVSPATSSAKSTWSKKSISAYLGLLFLVCLWLELFKPGLHHTTLLSRPTTDVCPQQESYDPREALGDLKIHRPSVKKSVQLLSEAVQINTTVGDNWPDPDKEPGLWNDIFSPFASWIESAFPLIHAQKSPVKREFIHRHGLLYTWKGTDASLKPLLLMSHQDVVPVEQNTAGKWTYPPFSGHIDLETQTVWGRGSVDCKLWLVSSLSSIESLLQSNFKPRRTVILSYGFDEEANGSEGAAHISRLLEDRYGPKSIGMIRFMNVKMVVSARGGHASNPPPHTSIGIMSSIIATLEAHPFPNLLTEASRPSIQQLQCSRDAPLMPRALRDALVRLEWAEKLAQPSLANSEHQQMPRWQRIWEWAHTSSFHQRRIDQARRRLIQALDPRTRTLLRTTQAVDLIHGGIKVNALPERTEAMVNHRIAPYSSIQEVLSRYRSLLTPLAQEMQFALTIEDEELVPVSNTTQAQVTINKIGFATNTHSPSPFNGPDADPFRLLSQVIRQTWRVDQPPVTLDSLNADAPPPSSDKWTESVRVSPTTMFANTDTRWYRNLTDHIFRFGAMSVHPFLTGSSPLIHIHTIDEHLP
ncbi:Gly-Xaa carboxypeptidase [Malassezia caprae]|uniref:Gly-Xaa carboxypeptidase n=1 Tax=Malassezia caprae TaxID=1381934 RepID=A0AAF0IZV2_9BASI|nr:Gly-Xaa carboxypeptidase [Malassezia caprae]